MGNIIKAAMHCSTTTNCTGCVWAGSTLCVERFAKEITKRLDGIEEEITRPVRAARHCAKSFNCSGCSYEYLSMADCLSFLADKLVQLDERGI